MKAYKIFDLHTDTDGKETPKTLFHGVQGSRLLPLGEWIIAEQKMVTDGSRQSLYLSGFHAYPSLAAVKQWLKSAKKLENRVIVKVQIEGLRDKPNAVRPTILADRMKISSQAWKARRPARDI